MKAINGKGTLNCLQYILCLIIFSLWFTSRCYIRMTHEGCYMNEHAHGALVH